MSVQAGIQVDEISIARDSGEIEEFLDRLDRPLVYYAAPFSRFLLRAVPGSEAHWLAARRDGRLVGLLPGLVKSAPGFGRVYNSLPFYGSHGGYLVDPACAEAPAVARALVAALAETTRDCASVTLIENPFAPMDAGLLGGEELVGFDDRIGQFTALPAGAADMDEALFSLFHQKTRNAARKGAKLGQRVERRTDEAAFAWMQGVHERSILALGGLPKPMSIFRALRKELEPADGMRLYVGSLDGAPVSGVLVLLYRDTVEYFTPVVEDAYKDRQALSDLIFRVMAELAREGYRLWNWGGTWRSQEGVYRFKSRWGAHDRVYRYFGRTTAAFRANGSAALAPHYPFFYLFKFS